MFDSVDGTFVFVLIKKRFFETNESLSRNCEGRALERLDLIAEL